MVSFSFWCFVHLFPLLFLFYFIYVYIQCTFSFHTPILDRSAGKLACWLAIASSASAEGLNLFAHFGLLGLEILVVSFFSYKIVPCTPFGVKILLLFFHTCSVSTRGFLTFGAEVLTVIVFHISSLKTAFCFWSEIAFIFKIIYYFLTCNHYQHDSVV